MSREIKFRAWFPKEFYSEPHMAYLDINDEFGGASSTWQLRYLQHPEEDGPIYMQYTGLKDKNGVEIYEGDIVEQYPDDIGYYIRTVEYKYHGFALSKLASFLQHDVDWSKQVKVIGNIHENPELLKAGN